jgi:hypothetical protein
MMADESGVDRVLSGRIPSRDEPPAGIEREDVRPVGHKPGGRAAGR